MRHFEMMNTIRLLIKQCVILSTRGIGRQTNKFLKKLDVIGFSSLMNHRSRTLPSQQAPGGPTVASRGPTQDYFSQWGRGGSCRFFPNQHNLGAPPGEPSGLNCHSLKSH